MKRFFFVGVLASAFLLVGCASGAAESTPGSVGSGVVGAPVDSGMVSAPGIPSAGATDTSKLNADVSSVSTDTSRSVVKNASVAVSVDRPLDIAGQLSTIATDAGGYVQDSSGSPATQYQGETANATLRVPAAALDSVTKKVVALGKYISSSQSEADVTLQVTDVNARITSLTTSVARLSTLMARATTTADLLAAESALAQRQAELDSLISQRDYLANQVDLATLSVSLIQTYDAAPTSQNFWDGLAQGWGSIVTAASAFVVALGFLLPWIVVLAGVGLLAWLIIWRVIRKRPTRAPWMSNKTPDETLAKATTASTAAVASSATSGKSASPATHKPGEKEKEKEKTKAKAGRKSK